MTVTFHKSPTEADPPRRPDRKDIDGGEFDLREILVLLRRQARLIASTFFIITAAAIATTLAISPTYTASALMLFDPSSKNLLDPSAQGIAPSSADSARIDSEVEIMRADSMLMQLIQSENLVADPEFGVGPGLRGKIATFLGVHEWEPPGEPEALAQVLEKLRSRIDIERRRLTYLIAIRVRSERPERAAELANTLAQISIARQIDAKVQSTLTARDTIRNQLEQARTAAVESEAEFSRHVAGNLGRAIYATERDDPERMRLAIAQSDLPPEILAQFHGLQQAARSATSNYQTLLTRLQALETEASLHLPDSRIVSAAIVPTDASFPNKTLIVLLAGIVALGAGIALAFLFENYVGGFTSAEQAEEIFRRPVGTVLPRVAPEAGSPTIADIVTDAPLSRYAEGVRRLRAVLDLALRPAPQSDAKDAGGAVIMISSTLAGEGKTSLSLALARTYALSGQRVILLDCDLRKPSVHRHLNVEGSRGLIDVLSGEVVSKDLSRILVNDPKSSLISIVGARQAHLPTDQFIASKSFGQIIESARRRFDYVILDSPPVEPVVDGLYLSQHADAVVFVTRWAKTSRRAALAAVERLSAMMRPGAALLLALNQEEGKTSAYKGGVAAYVPE